MQRMTVSDIVMATGGELVEGNGNVKIESIITDSRKTEKGSLFIPLAGEKFDGHNYIDDVVSKGASAVITHKDVDNKGIAVVKVKDTLTALGDIARYYKRKYNIPTVSITGSVGKTTTKDMIHAALSSAKNTLKTESNYNNNIGVPLTVFRLEKEHEMAVIEMGMNHFEEIDYLASIAEPDVAVITNIGMSHIENLGSQEGIFKAKMEVTNRFNDKNTLIVNGDDKFLAKTRGVGEYKTVYYGIHNSENDVYAKNIINCGLDGVKFVAVVDDKEYNVNISIPGEHNVYNALAAICVCREFGIETELAIKGIENVELTSGRLEKTNIGTKKIIKDYYNASPDSISAALKILSFADSRKVAVLGDVLEMGEFAKDAHYALGKKVVENNIDILVTAGENAGFIADGAKDMGMEKVYQFKTTEEAAKSINEILKDGDSVLLKASHGMCFGKIFDEIN